MEDYKKCYIAFIDVLGFKKLVNTKKCADILPLFNEFYSDYELFYSTEENPFVSNDIVKMKVMSDTICLYIDSSQPNAFACIIAACALFQFRLFKYSEPILLRGAIVKDYIYCKDDIVFGPGVSKAYNMEEHTAKYPRIIFNKCLLSENEEKADDKWTSFLEVNTYQDNDYFCCVDSLYMFYCFCNKGKEWKQFIEYVNYMLDNETDLGIREKYIYIQNQIKKTINKFNG